MICIARQMLCLTPYGSFRGLGLDLTKKIGERWTGASRRHVGFMKL